MLLDSPVCDFGWKAPDFSLKDPDGNHYSMSEQIGNKGLVIAFICNHCPYVKAIAERLAEDMKQLQKEGVNTLAVMSNDYQSVSEDSPENMVKFAKQYGFDFPYVIDEDQSVGKAYGAVCTPDFFGLNKNGELHYRGRLDDLRVGEADESERIPELVKAMRLIAETSKGPEKQYPSMGCSIKWSA